jgi:hypothetical protein
VLTWYVAHCAPGLRVRGQKRVGPTEHKLNSIDDEDGVAGLHEVDETCMAQWFSFKRVWPGLWPGLLQSLGRTSERDGGLLGVVHSQQQAPGIRRGSAT